MKTYLLSLFVLLLTIPSLASAGERRLVKAGPPGGKHGPVWKYEEKAESNRDCNYKSISDKKRNWPRAVNHKGGLR